MKHIYILALLALSISTASAQVRVVAPSQHPATDTIDAASLSIMFNNTVPPSTLLYRAGRHHQQALTSLVVCEVVGALSLAHANDYLNDHPGDPQPATYYLGIGAMVAGGILYLALDAISASETRKAAEQLQRITISAGGISYHF